jgi:hypothetical protein
LQYSGYIDVSYPANGTSTGYDVASIISAMSNVAPYGDVTASKWVVDSSEFYYLVTFPAKMGNVPQMVVHQFGNQLSPAGIANATATTDVEGNVVGGSFRLTFKGQTTFDIAYDASENDMRLALESLSTIDTVDVTRSTASNQRGYKWTITFTGSKNRGNVDSLTVDYSDLSVSNSDGWKMVNITSYDGNELGGKFRIGFTAQSGVYALSSQIAYDASAADLEAALEAMSNIPSGTLSVSRSGPDGQKGYSWTVSFLEDYARTFEGPQNLFAFNVNNLTGDGAAGEVYKLRVGTYKEIQLISVGTSVVANVTTNTRMILDFDGQYTQEIDLKPFNSSSLCNTSVTEVQSITTSTTTYATTGGYSDVSIYLQMRLRFGSEVTSWISDLTSCTSAASKIAAALEELSAFDSVSVSGSTVDSSKMTCKWKVTFTSSIGDIDQLQVQSYNSISGSYGSYGYSSTAGSDTVTTATVVTGQKDAIKAALEELSNVGTVTVTPTSEYADSSGACSWRVTFDTKAGDLPLLKAAVYDASVNTSVNTSTLTFATSSTNKGVTVTISESQDGTSSAISGNFSLTFRGARTYYLPYDADAREVEQALEALDTISDVEVYRSSADENNGYTWSVTFLTELGSLDYLEFDGDDMTGTVVTGVVAKAVTGVAPPFNSLDSSSGLPLGSAVVTDLSEMSLVIGSLSEGVSYYFRVAAVNTIGTGPYAYSSVPYAIPQLQRPGEPLNSTLAVVDGTTLQAFFESPSLDGGAAVTFYKVSGDNNDFILSMHSSNKL